MVLPSFIGADGRLLDSVVLARHQPMETDGTEHLFATALISHS